MPRPKGSKNKKQRGVKIAPTVSQDSLKWLMAQPESYGKAIDRAIKKLEESKQ